jgi:4'-phosphopantetheinyl transferase EntD
MPLLQPADLFPPGVAAAELTDFTQAGPLLGLERAAMAGAVEKRVCEFTAGRHCARRALTDLGFPPCAIPRGEDRAPCWPEGAVGSITHCDDYCAAVVGRHSEFAGLGLDAEYRDRVGAEVWNVIAGERDRGRRTIADTGTHRTIVFSAKEAFFKAQYHVTRSWVDFQDAWVDILDGERFEVVLAAPVAGLSACGRRFPGRYRIAGDIVLAAVSIARA